MGRKTVFLIEMLAACGKGWVKPPIVYFFYALVSKK